MAITTPNANEETPPHRVRHGITLLQLSELIKVLPKLEPGDADRFEKDLLEMRRQLVLPR